MDWQQRKQQDARCSNAKSNDGSVRNSNLNDAALRETYSAHDPSDVRPNLLQSSLQLEPRLQPANSPCKVLVRPTYQRSAAWSERKRGPCQLQRGVSRHR